MGKLKKLAHLGMLSCFVAMLIPLFTLQTDAANITYYLSDITSTNTAKTVTDGAAYTTVLEVGSSYKLPTALQITADGSVLSASDYTYSSSTGRLTIKGSAMYGEITIRAQAIELKMIEIPKVTGTFVVGETLNAVVTPADATVTYQWYRNKTIISGATSPTYTLTMADIGKEINVDIVGVGDYGGHRISTTNTIVSKKTTTAPSHEDVTVTNVTKNGGTNGGISANSERTLQYYDTVTNTWRSLPARNKAAGEYQIRFAETNDTLPSESIMVRIYEPCTGPVPSDVTVTHLATAGASTGKLTANTTKVLEFYDGSSWKTFPITGLRAGKYQVRFAATTDYLASEPTVFYVKEPSLLVITPQDVQVTNVSVNGASTGILKAASASANAMEVLVDNVWKPLPVRTLKAGTYQVRYAATETTFASGACSVTIKEPAEEPSGIKVTDVAVYGSNIGAISGLKTTWQISYDGTTWQDCTQTTLNALSAGSYYFRTKENDRYLASAVVEIIVRQPEPTPEATIDFVNGTLKNLVAGAKYLIGNVTYTASSDGTISVLDNALAGRSVEIIRQGNGTTTINSASQKMNLPALPAVPDAPVIDDKTDTAVKVMTIKGVEYSIDKKTWVTATGISYTFSDLKANTAYTVYARIKAVEGTSFASTNVGTPVTTKKSSSSAVPAKRATAAKITDTSITIQVVNGQEYRLGNDEWITPPGSTHTWSGLEADKTYAITTRTAATEDTMYSTSLTSAMTTYTKQKVGAHRLDIVKQAITGLTAGQYSINEGEPITVNSGGQLDVAAYFGRTIRLRRLGSAATETVDSDPVEVAILSDVAAPTEADFDPAVDVRATLAGFVIAEPLPALEYQVLDTDGFPVSDWKSSTGEEITFDGLQDDTSYLIQVCFRATETQPKSNAYITESVRTQAYEATPAAKIDTLTQRLINLKAGAAYLINGTSRKADANGTIVIDDVWVDGKITVVKCGDGVKTVDSAAQKLTLPGRVSLTLQATVEQVTYHDGDNGSIGGLSTDMEYSADGGATWTAVTANTLTGLRVQDYLIRRRGVADQLFASLPQTVSVTLATEIAAYKQQVVDALEAVYEEKANSRRYTDTQLEQLRAILDAGIRNINVSLSDPADVDNAKGTVLDNMAQVPCANTPTADGKLVGSDITADELLQYPNDSDEVWGNVSNPEGLDADLLFVMEKQGSSATEELRALIAQAIEQGEIGSFDGSLTDAEIQALLQNAELKLALEIALMDDETPTDDFHGIYTVTMLLPINLQSMQELGVVSVDENGKLSYHPAVVTGYYLTFDTTHFSSYVIVGADTLSIAKTEAIEDISDRYASLREKDYSREHWGEVQAAVVQALEAVNGASTEQEVSDEREAFLQKLDAIPTKSPLSWLWILLLVVIVLVAILIACYLVWRVRYHDGEERIAAEFHVVGTKVTLLAYSKEGWVLDGWYYDRALTDRAENGFPMPWQGVKLYAKWNKIEILAASEEAPLIETESEAPAIAELPASEEPIENIETLPLPAAEDTDEQTSESEFGAASDENIFSAEETDAAEETVDETAEETVVGDAVEESEAVALTDESESETASSEDGAAEDVPQEPKSEDGEEASVPYIVIGAENGQVSEEEMTVDHEESDYKLSRPYRAWLAFGEEDADLTADEEEKLEDVDEVQLFTNEKTGERYHIRFNISFRAKLTALSEEAKSFYCELKNEFLLYQGVKSRISWKNEAIRRGRETVARLAVRDGMLCVFLALDPDQYQDSKYVFESVKEIKAYEGVPMLIRVKSDLSCRKVKELITELMQARDVKRTEETPTTDYAYLYEDSSTEARLRAGQLRIWAEGPDADICNARAAAAALHYLIAPETTTEEAEGLISDEMLDALLPPSKEILIVADRIQEISLETLCRNFYVGDTVDVAALKRKGLMDAEMTYLKVTASAEMTKKLTVRAHMFERTAAKMILLTGGDADIITE